MQNKHVETRSSEGWSPTPSLQSQDMFAVYFHNLPYGSSSKGVIRKLERYLPNFKEQFDVTWLQGDAHVRPKLMFPDQTIPSSQSIPSENHPNVQTPPQQLEFQARTPSPREPQPPLPLYQKSKHTAETLTPWAIEITSRDHDLQFFRNWFLQKKCGTLQEFCERLPQNRFFIPFASSSQLDQAIQFSKELVESDPSISVQRWIPTDIREEFHAARSTMRVDDSRAIFIRGLQRADRENLRTIFQQCGAIERIIPTSERTAIMEFRTTTAHTALLFPIPSTHQHLRTEAYHNCRQTRGTGFHSQRVQSPHSRPETQKRARRDRSAPRESTDQVTGSESASRNSGREDANRQQEMEQFNQPQYSPMDHEDGHGGGGQDTVLHSQHNEEPLLTSPRNVNPAQIEENWTKTDSDTWILGTKKLDRKLQPKGLRTIPVQADGNCAYHAIIASSGLRIDYTKLKSDTDHFLTTNESNILAALNVHNSPNEDAFVAKLHQKLRSQGAYTNQYLLQLVAWHINKDIEIHDVLDDHVITLQGQRPWNSTSNSETQNGTICIAYRRHQQHWSYDNNFSPLAKLDGHYWGIVALSTNSHRRRQQQPLSTFNSFSPLASNDVDMQDATSQNTSGNNTASASPRR